MRSQNDEKTYLKNNFILINFWLQYGSTSHSKNQFPIFKNKAIVQIK